MRVADYVVARLLSEGIDNVFLVTGGGAMHLNDAFARNSDMKVTCFHHEQAAAIAAEGYARIKQQACALNVTTGPGGINALNGVYGAYVDSMPMFIVSGQVKLETIAASYPDIPMRQLGDQEVDIVAMVRPIVKYVRTVRHASEIEKLMERAIFLMKSGRPGPVWLDIPIDIQGALFQSNSGLRELDSRTSMMADFGCTKNTLLELEGTPLDVTEIHQLFMKSVEYLMTAKRPVIMVGTGASSIQARLLLNRFLEKTDIPIVTGWNAMDLVPSDHRNFAGRPGTVGDRAGNFAVQNADYILVIGCRLNIRQISYNWKSFAKNAFKVMVDIDKAELYKPTLNINFKIHASVEDYLGFINDIDLSTCQEGHRQYRQWCKDRVNKYPVVEPEYKQDGKLNPYYFLSELSKLLPSGSTVVAGNGSACVMSFQAFEVKANQRIFTNSGCASMGYDLPAAIGACIAKNHETVFCIAGDGSIMMNLQELQTVQSLGLPIKIILLNNDGYLSIRQTQTAYFPDNVFGTDSDDGLAMPNFINIAQGFGLSYGKIAKIQDLYSEEIKLIFKSPSPAFIEVFVDTDQGFLPKLASRKNEDGSMSSPELEDMAPFLSRDELRSNMLS